jgi:hypothetical protein
VTDTTVVAQFKINKHFQLLYKALEISLSWLDNDITLPSNTTGMKIDYVV